MIKWHYLAISIFLIIANLASTAVGETTPPYSANFDLRNMVGFNDNIISAEDIVAFIQEKYPNSPMLNEADIGNCFINDGQSNNVNPAFLVATACLEGGFGTLGWANSHPECHNTFGYGIPSGTTLPDDINCMDGWCAMIQRVASVIAHGHNYYAQGLYTVNQVRSKYAASPNADSIANLMNELYIFSVNHKAITGLNAAVEVASIGTQLVPQTNTQEIYQQEASTEQVASTIAFNLIETDIDKVGSWDNGNPDGHSDGRFILDLYLPAPTEIKSILVYSSDQNGNPSGGKFWDSADSGHWILGVFNQGTQLNKNHIPSLGVFSGQVQFDLYCNDGTAFQPGKFFGLKVTFGELRELIMIPSS